MIIEVDWGLSAAEKDFLSEVISIIKLILLAPATNAMSERSFSAFRRLKTYLRSTMGDKRLESLMLLHILKDLTDLLNLVDVSSQFIEKSERRKKIFEHFTILDIQKAKTFASVATQTYKNILKCGLLRFLTFHFNSM